MKRNLIKNNTQGLVRYCAFLRGVNVGGINMKMAEACKVFEKEGLGDVSSILASGNILFSSNLTPKTVENKLKKSLGQYFNYDAHLFILDSNSIQNLVKNNPFNPHPDFHIYSFVGIEHIADKLMNEFKNSRTEPEELAKVIHHTFYWRVPKSHTLLSQFGKILGRKDLRDSFTSRNMNTFERILKKL